MMTPASRLVFLALAGVSLCACSSSDSGSKKSSSETGPKYAERSKKSNWSPKHRSTFEKQAQEAEKNKTVKAGSFHTGRNFHTNEVSSSTTDKKYKGKDFAQSDKKNSSFEKSYQGANEKNRMGSESFKTSESSMNDKKSSQSGREFSGSSQTFKTKDDTQAANAGKKPQEPKIIENRKPGYTEDEVRAMLNKG